MLPILAMVVGGYLAKQGGIGGGGGLGGGLGGILGQVLGGGATQGQQAPQAQGGLSGILGSLLRGSGGTNPLDAILDGLGRR